MRKIISVKIVISVALYISLFFLDMETAFRRFVNKLQSPGVGQLVLYELLSKSILGYDLCEARLTKLSVGEKRLTAVQETDP